MTCREVMTPDPVCCIPTDTAVGIAKLMKAENIGSVPICDDRRSKRLLGIVTDRDLVLKVIGQSRDPRTTRAEEVMTQAPVACRGEDDLQRALDLMQKNQVRRIPVVAENQELIGIIAQADVALRVGQPRKTGEVVQEISRPSQQPA
jgi:CBS domain-containing protein